MGCPSRGSALPAAQRRSEFEVIAELKNYRVEIRHLRVPDLVSDQLLRGSLAFLAIELEARAPFVASRCGVPVLEADGESVEVRETCIGAGELRQRRAVGEAVSIERRRRLRVITRVRLEVARFAERKAESTFEGVRIDFPVVGGVAVADLQHLAGEVLAQLRIQALARTRIQAVFE